MMIDILATTTSGNYIQMKATDGDVVRPRLRWEHVLSTEMPLKFFWAVFRAQTLTASEKEFQEQERLFQQIPPLLLEQYRGRFVASISGQIVDSDEDFVTLTHRFFETYGEVPVYITKIGDDEGIVIETPFFD